MTLPGTGAGGGDTPRRWILSRDAWQAQAVARCRPLTVRGRLVGFHHRVRHPLHQELAHQLIEQDSVSVLDAHGGVAHLIVRADDSKLAEKQGVVKRLHQQAVEANHVERLQQSAPVQLKWVTPMGGRLRPTAPRGGVESSLGLIRQIPDPPQRMVGRDPLLNRDVLDRGVAEQGLSRTGSRSAPCGLASAAGQCPHIRKGGRGFEHAPGWCLCPGCRHPRIVVSSGMGLLNRSIPAKRSMLGTSIRASSIAGLLSAYQWFCGSAGHPPMQLVLES